MELPSLRKEQNNTVRISPGLGLYDVLHQNTAETIHHVELIRLRKALKKGH